MQIGQLIENQIGIHQHNQIKILITFLVFIVLWIITLHHFKNCMEVYTDDVRRRYAWRTALAYTFPFLGLLHNLYRSGSKLLKNSVHFLGLMAAGLAIALKDPLTNFAGWLFIVIRKPFTVGDQDSNWRTFG